MSEELYHAVREASVSWNLPQKFEDVVEWGRCQLMTTIDLLAAWFDTGNPVYRELFAGWIDARMVRDLSEVGAPAEYRADKALQFATEAWLRILKLRLSAEAAHILESDLERTVKLLARPAIERLRILFIGDCIQFETIAALAGACVAGQIGFESTIFNQRIQPILRNQIRALRPDEFDLVFYSPFSHRYLPEYDVLLNAKSGFWPAAKTARHVDALLTEVFLTVDALASQLECPIYVHNTAATIQIFGTVSGFAKNFLSRRNRSWARDVINRGIAHYLHNPLIESHVHLLDENNLHAQASDYQLGRAYLNSYAFHPTRLGIDLGRNLYYEAVYATTFLAGKKVVVCDLDNTLWEGVIGEGEVKHYHERQALLKELRQRGVLLSINSKNDPHNVHWTGATLDHADFVAPQINWNSKTANIATIRGELNLKLKDFVFLDDRPDELERIRNAFPEILAMNAADPVTWKLLRHWQECLPPRPDDDRTRQYHERVERDRFVSELSHASTVVEDEAAALKALQLSVKIAEAGRSGLKRAAELINRTNQFNLCGSRTNVRELEDGLGTGHSVITAEAADKFGSMGVVGVMRVDWEPEGLEIPIFVLSCRAFGFGIEYALLNAVKALVDGDYRLVGLYRETQYNQPCRELYSVSGLRWDGSRWNGRVGDLPPDPAWLHVEDGVTQRQSEVGSGSNRH